MADAAQLEKWVTESEIKSLLVRERYYRDTKRWKELRECYHPDASKTHINITWFNGNIDDFTAGSEKMAASSRTASNHTICPVLIHRQGNKVVTESTGSILVRLKHKGEEYGLISFTRFINRLEKVDSEWKMLTMECIYERDLLQPVKPGKSSEIEDLDQGRESYKCLSWLLAQNGFKVDQNLPGIDLPGSAEKLLDTSLDWLREDIKA